jgi:hypothetical protein
MSARVARDRIQHRPVSDRGPAWRRRPASARARPARASARSRRSPSEATTLIGTKSDIAPDGRILSVYEGIQSGVPEIRVILNWFDELKARVPVR